ncbi:MAG: 23S rRNA (uracil(1939)-C(5))-methyltransferase RlmD [Armatimonadota bacterium]|nr:23S rRNA (uracil(1939)-C(5))-methyltransferase RlmD [Armatimonadota bacterium]MDR7532464.1 23S rRNA (uracil(1939)-C(5))-methyltransferase RlmD [Armatimonadota bacterium]MDR7535687.1 23S rRNA (uracil(1939)-C(5))-methyltransferase RlmD [Armatimonadota bacterium]
MPRAGERLTVRFTGLTIDGAAIARVGPATVSVPFGVPGEDALVEVTRGGRRAEGRLVALLRKSADVTPARCQHFGRCGGCQWQHLIPDAQRRLKTRLVRDFLKEHAGLRRDLVAETVGGEAWAYRSVLRATVATREGRAVVGFHTAGGTRVVDVAACPVQHPANEAILHAVRRAVRGLRWPPYDRTTGQGLVRGVLGLAAFATGEALLVVSTARALPDPTALVHALIDRVPGLVGILHTIQPAPTLELLGKRVRLLWGRAYIEDEVAGYRLRLRSDGDLPPNPGALRLLLDAIVRLAAPGPRDAVLDLHASTPLPALALAGQAQVATGLVPGRRLLEDYRAAAASNGVPNAVFVAGDPVRYLARLTARGRTPQVVLAESRGVGLEPALVAAVAGCGVPRVVSVTRSLAACAHDLAAWQRAGYRVEHLQPVDLLPHTSHVHVVASLHRIART